MPGLDTTGPFGEGPMTGFRRGFCGASAESTSAGNTTPGAYAAGIRRGMGRGIGMGYGRCRVGLRGFDPDSVPGRGSGRGAGFGMAGRLACGPTWYAVGYGEQGESPLVAGARHALAVRKELLEAELARVQSILGESVKTETGSASGNTEK